MNERRQDRIAVLVMMLACGALLGSRVEANWSPATDAAELTLCAVFGGVPHSPGYPLWTWLARLVVDLPTGLHPVAALSWMGVGLACLAALFSRAFLRAYGVRPWAATASAALLLVVPTHIRAFTIPEVYALDLLLLCSSAWAVGRGAEPGREAWRTIGLALAVLAVGHRPLNIVFFAVICVGWVPGLLRSRASWRGLAIGLGLQGILLVDLWYRVQNPTTPWTDEAALPDLQSFLVFVSGLSFSEFFVWGTRGGGHTVDIAGFGLQAIGLMCAALLVVLVWPVRRQGFGLLGLVVSQLTFILVYRISDSSTLLTPILWVGVLVLGVATVRLPDRQGRWVGPLMALGVASLAWTNHQSLGSRMSEAWQASLQAVLTQVPEHSVVVSDDWLVRSGLVAIREVDGLGSTVDVVRVTPTRQGASRIEAWLRGAAPLIQLEEHAEVDGPRPLRLFDKRLIQHLEDRGLQVTPAEAGTWAVILPAPS